jgi:hypothetical protein
MRNEWRMYGNVRLGADCATEGHLCPGTTLETIVSATDKPLTCHREPIDAHKNLPNISQKPNANLGAHLLQILPVTLFVADGVASWVALPGRSR